MSPSSFGTLPQVMLYFCPLNVDEINLEQVEQIRQWLSEDELTKVSRYIQPQARDKGLMVRGYLRGILSLHSGTAGKIAPQDWRFVYGEKGKPDLIAKQRVHTGLKFNISHSGDWLVIAVLDAKQTSMADTYNDDIELGVDIERSRANTNIYSILNHYFTPTESDELLTLPEHLQRERFFDLWALKESYIKAKGLGLSLSLKSFSFDFSQMIENRCLLEAHGSDIKVLPLFNNIALNIHDEHRGKNADDSRWSVYLAKLNEEYRFALSISNVGKVDLNTLELTVQEMLARLDCDS